MSTLKSPVVKFLLFFSLFCIALYVALRLLSQGVFSQYDLFYSPMAIVIFLYLSTIAIFMSVNFIHQNFPDKSGFAFMALGMLKMFAAVVFLIPLIQSEIEDKIPATLFFFGAYFVVLALETINIVRLVSKNQKF